MILTNRGVTLPELLAVLVVVGILAAIALPALAGTLAGWRLERAREALTDGLMRARVAAVYGNTSVIVCPREKAGCTQDGDWSDGWIARAGRPTGIVAGGEPLHPSLAAIATRHRDDLHFGPNGTASGRNQTIVLCVRGKPATAIAVVVSSAGRIRHEPHHGTTAALCAAHARKTRREA